jgi:hypothetical protein
MSCPHIAALCVAFVCWSSESEAAKMGHHPWEKTVSWEDWDSLTYPQKCVHVATPKTLQYKTFSPSGPPDAAAVSACQRVTSDEAIHCLRAESKKGSESYRSLPGAGMRVFPALTASQVKACATLQ